MRKLITFINMTLDGYCNHTAVIADDDLHLAVNELFRSADTAIFGRITYQLMEDAWPPLVDHPSGNRPMDEFAVLIHNISKIVFSTTLKEVKWKNARLAKDDLLTEVQKLKDQPGKNILVGSPTLINALTREGMIDEYQLCVQPIVLGGGLPLFRDIRGRTDLELLDTTALCSGAVILRYKPVNRG